MADFLRARTATLTLLLALPSTLAGQGFSVSTHSACMSARNAAGVANPCEDGSAVFYNPAAVGMQGGAVSIGVTGIQNSNTFTWDRTGETVERDGDMVPVPHGWATYALSPRLGLGLGVWAPYGLTSEWDLDFEGRFVGYDNSLESVYVQPTAAYEAIPGVLRVGAGLDVVFGSVDLNQRLDLSEQPVPAQPFTFASLGIAPGTDFADARLEGSGTAVTGHAGLHLRVTDRLSFGARYMHSATLEMDDGSASFDQVNTGIVLEQGNPLLALPGVEPGTSLDDVLAPRFETGVLAEQNVATEFTLPAQAVVGLSFFAMPELELLADYQWFGWSSFDVVPLAFERLPADTLLLDYRDAHVLRLGADYALSPTVDLRAGYIRNTPATPDAGVTPRLPEAERDYYSAGVGYRAMDRLAIDLMYTYLDQADRRGSVRGRESLEQTAEEVNTGLYTAHGHLFGITASYRLGPSW